MEVLRARSSFLLSKVWKHWLVPLAMSLAAASLLRVASDLLP